MQEDREMTTTRRSAKRAGTKRRGAAGASARRQRGKGRRVAPRSRRWSQRVTRTSNALDLERSVFARNDPLAIARSLKRSAERSRRRKSEPFRSAMSMLTFYVNRAGRTLGARRRAVLERAKRELRRLFDQPERAR